METLLPLIDSSLSLSSLIGVVAIIQLGKIDKRLAVLEALNAIKTPQK